MSELETVTFSNVSAATEWLRAHDAPFMVLLLPPPPRFARIANTVTEARLLIEKHMAERYFGSVEICELKDIRF